MHEFTLTLTTADYYKDRNLDFCALLMAVLVSVAGQWGQWGYKLYNRPHRRLPHTQAPPKPH